MVFSKIVSTLSGTIISGSPSYLGKSCSHFDSISVTDASLRSRLNTE